MKYLTITFLEKITRKEILEYVKELHVTAKKQNKKICKYKETIKILKRKRKTKFIDRTTQTDKLSTTPATIVQEITEAAEAAQNQTDFLYEPTSGLYYDQKTGYYYNAEYGLYYDGTRGCYYKYDQEKNEFQFHSQVQSSPNDNKANGQIIDDGLFSKKSKIKTKVINADKFGLPMSEKEDGEIEADSDNDSNLNFRDVANNYPPSLRIVVHETNLKKLKVGALAIITFKGGTLGREGDHEMIVPDVNVSKFHLKFIYDQKKELYQCIDLGSRNGTILNGKRMANAKQESEPFDLVHGSVIQVGQTKLLCHIHNGNSTCGHCEPGLIISKDAVQYAPVLSRHKQLKFLQKRYGLECEKYNVKLLAESYKDRAAERRNKVGSTNEHEKTQTSSIETEIASDNIGFKMLSKLGWNKGESLGKAKDGTLEPIKVYSKNGKQGLGCEQIFDIKSNEKKKLWEKAQERYKDLTEVEVVNNDNENKNIFL